MLVNNSFSTFVFSFDHHELAAYKGKETHHIHYQIRVIEIVIIHKVRMHFRNHAFNKPGNCRSDGEHHHVGALCYDNLTHGA